MDATRDALENPKILLPGLMDVRTECGGGKKLFVFLAHGDRSAMFDEVQENEANYNFNRMR